MDYQRLLIDGNSQAHAHHNSTVLTCGDMQTQAIFGVLKSLKFLREKHPTATPVELWDGSIDWRANVFPEYKANREAKTEEDVDRRKHFDKQIPFLKYALDLLGIKQIRHNELEADDLGGLMTRDPKGPTTLLVTGDTDWIQLISERVHWYDPRFDKLVTPGTLFSQTGYYTPAEFLQGKALRGDTTDNIPGVGGIGKDTAPHYLATWRDMNKFFAAIDDGSYKPKERKSKAAKTVHPEQALASPEGRALFKRNMDLMDLRVLPMPAAGIAAGIKITNGPVDIEKFRIFCGRFGFHSILREFEAFVATINRSAFMATKEAA